MIMEVEILVGIYVVEWNISCLVFDFLITRWHFIHLLAFWCRKENLKLTYNPP
jgi:hypothetical protein